MRRNGINDEGTRLHTHYVEPFLKFLLIEVGIIKTIQINVLDYSLSLGIQLLFELIHINSLTRRISALDAAQRLNKSAVRYHLLQFHEEASLGKVVEFKYQFLTFLFHKLAHMRIVHEPDIAVAGRISHVLKSDLLLPLPVVAAKEE